MHDRSWNVAVNSTRVVIWALIAAMVATLAPSTPAAEEEVSYSMDIQPVLNTRCVTCHQPGGAGYAESGLDLTSYEGLMKGTKHGPIVTPGDARLSNFNVLIEGRASPELRMPHNERPLLRYQILTIRDWVNQGALDN